MRTIARFVFLAGLLLASANVASAQQAPAFRGGEEVIVVHAGSGQELRGRLLELSSTSLGMLVDGRRVEVPIGDVLRIDGRKDSLKNGALIGLGVFGGSAAIGCAAVGSSPGWCAYGIAMNGMLGAAIGAGIDALHKGRSPIYVKPAASGAALQVKLRF